MTALDIDIWSDVMCPWCAVGYANLSRALEQVGDDVDATIRWMPFELNPEAPPAGKSQAAHIAEVYGRSPGELAAMRQTMSEKARAAGFPLDYTGGEDPPPVPMMWNTFDAHKLLRWALASAGAAMQTRLKLALFAAHLRERRDVSDHQVLADVAASIGLDREEALAALLDPALGEAIRHEEARAKANGITAVPTFVIAGKYVLQGSAEPAQFARALTQIATMEAAA
ncbi:DsbA family oxidoreductase [Aurantiacibacter arachoides]|uniref:DsbA family oxidoreductase n=1 Tax=Aurantiacibacter arachoides TaxID=1850444 RepID=UPI0019A931E7|nr:DsbA family oxidoreductase [Aurantiacibacter arachoides]GGD47148.1 2-hydroxychromene-2-carboxylate isomerase [Aurantiacibacter arachoides]